MKAQLENSQEEVITGTQGVTSGQEGPERARNAVFSPYYRWHYKARANLPGPDKTEPAGSEKKSMFLIITRTVPFRSIDSDSRSEQARVYGSHF
jgi:hypothetical protein